ncbi:MAG: zf-HC2 domain-containing protein [Deltaproteobacteria bacterium]|nr:zf-HC2 domain-containing protein [Deltaproteobacteria bacterium]
MTSDDHDHQQCLEMFEKLSEYIDGELDHATCEEIEKHANNCVACFACMETLKKTVALCKNVEDQPIPQDFSDKLKEIIKNLPKTTTP